MQIESNTKRIAFFFIAECSFILFKFRKLIKYNVTT